MDLKIKAAKERKSVAAVIREELSKEQKEKKKKKVKEYLKEFDKLALVISKENKGINFTEELVKMRYEK